MAKHAISCFDDFFPSVVDDGTPELVAKKAAACLDEYIDDYMEPT
jgi:hypothetical protein